MGTGLERDSSPTGTNTAINTTARNTAGFQLPCRRSTRRPSWWTEAGTGGGCCSGGGAANLAYAATTFSGSNPR